MSKPVTYLVKTVNGVKRQKIYYDPDIFDNTVLLSASLIIGEGTQIELDNLNTHYNTINNEDNGTDGSSFQDLEDILIPIYPKPKITKIVGPNRVDKNNTLSYFIDPSYDETEIFTYFWEIQSGDATIVGGDGTSFLGSKNINVSFFEESEVWLKVTITNPSGCYRILLKRILIGIVPKKMLVVRNIFN
jgi:hypothetical protein